MNRIQRLKAKVLVNSHNAQVPDRYVRRASDQNTLTALRGYVSEAAHGTAQRRGAYSLRSTSSARCGKVDSVIQELNNEGQVQLDCEVFL
ncbi:unnamed protein product, partial [Brenthis ino]